MIFIGSLTANIHSDCLKLCFILKTLFSEYPMNVNIYGKLAVQMFFLHVPCFSADFGLARKYEVPLKPMTPCVVTLW